MVDHQVIGQGPTDAVLGLLGPRSPIKCQAAETAALRDLAIKPHGAVRDRVRMHDGIIADEAEVTALRAFKAEIHEIAPAAFAPCGFADYLAVVLDDGDDVALSGEPRDGAVGRAAVDDDDFKGTIDL